MVFKHDDQKPYRIHMFFLAIISPSTVSIYKYTLYVYVYIYRERETDVRILFQLRRIVGIITLFLRNSDNDRHLPFEQHTHRHVRNSPDVSKSPLSSNSVVMCERHWLFNIQKAVSDNSTFFSRFLRFLSVNPRI